MPGPLDDVGLVFQYPRQVHVRRHGPVGYANYQSYKPWLRDEFEFRCVYCLWRERWHSVGEDAFSVEHLESRAAAPARICDYDNLVYACCRCNSVKTDAHCVLDPCRQAYGLHLEIHADGAIGALTAEGSELIEICQLARPRITDARRRLLDLLRTLQEARTPRANALLKQYLSYPDNLPILSQHRPPGGNNRPDGIIQSCQVRKHRGELLAVY
jgi:hypothetical protein